MSANQVVPDYWYLVLQKEPGNDDWREVGRLDVRSLTQVGKISETWYLHTSSAGSGGYPGASKPRRAFRDLGSANEENDPLLDAIQLVQLSRRSRTSPPTIAHKKIVSICDAAIQYKGRKPSKRPRKKAR